MLQGLRVRRPLQTVRFSSSCALMIQIWMTWVGTAAIQTKKHTLLPKRGLRLGSLCTCTGMSGNGARIGMELTLQTLLPIQPEHRTFRTLVLRDGSWNSYVVHCRSANRNGLIPGYWFNFLDFRLMRET